MTFKLVPHGKIKSVSQLALVVWRKPTQIGVQFT
jgi:hypothetical protein